MTWPRVTGTFRPPDPMATRDQFDRFFHRDLPEKDERGLRQEYDFLRSHLWPLPDDDWRRERVQEIEREFGRRRAPAVGNGGTWNRPTSPSSPKRPIVEVDL